MKKPFTILSVILTTAVTTAIPPSFAAAPAAQGQGVSLVQRRPDPYGSPRPFGGATDVALRTSLYFVLEPPKDKPGDRVLPGSITLSLQAEGGDDRALLLKGGKFADGARGWLRPGNSPGAWTVYVDPGFTLEPAAKYTARVRARSRAGVELSALTGTWSFTTEAVPTMHALDFALDLGKEPVRWHGGFFDGICNVMFCTHDDTYGGLYRMMQESHALHPRAWRYQRDINFCDCDDRTSAFMGSSVPNLVRELQTRHIISMKEQPNGLLLQVEDFFGHEQYAIQPDRPLSQDYHAGEEILIADGVGDARSIVLAVDDAAHTILVKPVLAPKEGWQLDYQSPPPGKEDPEAPGTFVSGGTYLRRFDPPGTPVYFWRRLDKEWDLAHKQGGRRLVVDFVGAFGDLSLTDRPFTRPKDYGEWHEVVRTITSHLIERYGRDALSFSWSVFNEPDIVGDYWPHHWDEAQRFYDYTVDGILRAFEDHGFDGKRVMVGGWELGAIFGVNLRLNEVLAHCSPRAQAKGALPTNAAFADPRLDGKRSHRVEELCRAHDGKGCPCDFISVHTYNRAALAAAKLIRAKEMALAIDPDYYRDLWIDSHESCPDWAPPPDPGASDSYLGDGYFSTWCLDVVDRQLQQAAADPRYAMGESVVTIWPPPRNFTGIDTLALRLVAGGNAGQATHRVVTVPTPIFHLLTLLSDLGPDYWVMPSRQIDAFDVGGFASRDATGAVRIALFSHQPLDIQSRSEQQFQINLQIARPGGKAPFRVTEYRFDQKNNSYFTEALALRDEPASGGTCSPDELDSIEQALAQADPAAMHDAFKKIEKLDPPDLMALAPALLRTAGRVRDPELQDAAKTLIQRVFGEAAQSRQAYPSRKIEEVEDLAKLHPTSMQQVSPARDGSIHLTIQLRGNGADMLVLEPAIP